MTAPKAPITSCAAHCLDSIVGHGLVKSYLTNALKAEMLPHALLLHGPKGVGKCSLAYAMCKVLNCHYGAPLNCSCDVCRKITEGSYADVLMVEPRGAAGQITLNGWKPGKDDPDGLQYYRFLDTRPLEGARKIVIIRSAERMNTAVANHILKLIEEPPSYLILVLLAQRRGDMLMTIRSRCAPVKLSPLGGSEMAGFARQVMGTSASQTEIDAAVRLSEGRPGLLLERAEETASQRRAEIGRLMKLFQQYGFLSLFRVASELQKTAEGGKGAAASQDNFENVLSLMTGWLRDAVICKSADPTTAGKLLVNRDAHPLLEEYVMSQSLESLIRAAECIPEFSAFATRQTDRSYVLESLLLQMGRSMKG